MKKLILTLGIFAASAAAYAQIGIGISGGMNVPMGDFGDKDKGGFKSGFGVGIHGTYALNDNMKVGLNTGYFSFTNASSDLITLRIIPVEATFQYYFATDAFKPYAGLGAGMYLCQAALDGKTDGIDAVNKFGINPHVGAAYAINDNMDLFGQVGYNMIFSKDDAKGTVDFSSLKINIGVMYNID